MRIIYGSTMATKKTKKTENNDVKLSVLDIEKKYIIDPEETTYGNNGIVSWGVDNSLPVLYRNCYNQSATLKSIIDGTINYIIGDDIIIKDSAAKWSKEVNRTGMTPRQFFAKLSFNLNVYGALAVQVIYNKLGNPVELFPLEVGKCRTNESGSKVFYSQKRWTKYQTKAEEYDAWDPDKVKINMENPTQIYFFKGDYTSSVYSLPPYAGALYDVLTEVECSKYSLNTVARGFSAKYLIQFPENANLTDEQKKGVEDAIKTKFCGSESEVNFLLYWRNGDGDAEKIEVNKIESDETPERYVAVKDNARQNIYCSMKCTPLLFGLPNASNGFSTQEYSDSFKLFQRTVIAPQQDILIETFSKLTGTQDGVEIVPFTINFENRDKEGV